MRSKRLLVGFIIVALLVALGGFAYRFYLNPAHDNAVDLVPPDAVLYASVFLSPSTHQKQALEALLKHFPKARTPELAKSALEELLDPVLARVGIDFTHDVEPWVGRQVAFFAAPAGTRRASMAMLVATRNKDSAQRALEKVADAAGSARSHRSYQGVDYTVFDTVAAGIVGDFVVGASDAHTFESVVRAYGGRSLEDEEDFRIATDSLPKDRVGTFYVQSSAVPSLMPSPPSIAGSLFADIPSMGVGAFLRSDAIVFDAAHGPGSISPAGAASLKAAASTLLPPAIGKQLSALLGDAGGTGSVDASLVAAGRAGLGADYALKGVVDPHALDTVAGERAEVPETAKALLGPVSYVALGTRSDHETLFARIVIGVR